VHFEAAGAVPVAIAEDLLAMKLLAARPDLSSKLDAVLSRRDGG